MAASPQEEVRSRAEPREQSPALYVCMHQITSLGSSFREAMEGYAQAGIEAVEPHLEKVREFEQDNGAGAARRLLDDLGLKVVSSSNQLYLDETGPQRPAAVENLKWKLDMMAAIGADRLVIPSVASADHEPGDYREVVDNYREVAELARPYNVVLMVEFTRVSRLISNLRTALQVVREVNHPHLKLMLDLYHFWSGTSKTEDLELLGKGELHHLHFADTPASPHYEVFHQKDRAWPGEGIAPLQKLVDAVLGSGYQGPASLELFDPAVQNAPPEQVARKAIACMSPFLKS